MIEEQKGIADAENLLEELGFDTLPIVPVEVAGAISSASFGVQYEERSFQSDTFMGKAIGDNSQALIIINSNITETSRKNFTGGHEIGHVCMHIMKNIKQTFECGKEKFRDDFSDPIERQANGFASGLLMPRRLILPKINKEITWKTIKIIMDSCGTSHEATFRRLTFLLKDPVALVMHQNGKFSRFVKPDNFEFRIERSPLSPEQIAQVADPENSYPEHYETVDAMDWVNPRAGYKNLATIYSSSITLKNGFVYTLLTYDEDCFDDA